VPPVGVVEVVGLVPPVEVVLVPPVEVVVMPVVLLPPVPGFRVLSSVLQADTVPSAKAMDIAKNKVGDGHFIRVV